MEFVEVGFKCGCDGAMYRGVRGVFLALFVRLIVAFGDDVWEFVFEGVNVLRSICFEEWL